MRKVEYAAKDATITADDATTRYTFVGPASDYAYVRPGDDVFYDGKRVIAMRGGKMIAQRVILPE